ncbi:NUDIX domain-containing protein [Listeria valentina]|uniref:NUDIX domain-containing protein n=1 Tax=Listeria valentina TaxID=2705293 RepID=UPI00142FB06B|nr:NUDIX domain-containing protein [Listeria valentina]
MKPVIPAVKAVIIQGNSFLGLQKAEIAQEVYDLPGGKIQYGETQRECLVREVFEETGLHITQLALYDTWNMVFPDYQMTGIFYLVKISGKDRIQLSKEHQAYKWLPFSEKGLSELDIAYSKWMSHWDFDSIIEFMK